MAAAAGVSGFFAWTGTDSLRFRAVAGMPRDPLPAYASYVIEGKLDLKARTGQIAKSLYAGAPDAMSGVVFPGTARSILVTGVTTMGDTVRVNGRLADTSSLLQGESPNFVMELNRTSGTARADFLGSQVVMHLDE